MTDPRDREYAELIVGGCLGVQPGWRVYVCRNPQARSLLAEVCGAVARRGAYARLGSRQGPTPAASRIELDGVVVQRDGAWPVRARDLGGRLRLRLRRRRR